MRVEMLPVNARVRVAVIFEANGRIKPVWFEISDQRVKVQEVYYTWSYHEGATTILNFAVWDGVQAWELVYNVREGCWILKVQSIAA